MNGPPCFDGSVGLFPGRYEDRDEAGRVVAELVAKCVEAADDDRPPIVLGLPRGGVPVAAPVAERLGADLDVLTVRKIGAPGQRELAVGAVASGGLTVLNDELIAQLRLPAGVVRRPHQCGAARSWRRRRNGSGAVGHHSPSGTGCVVIVDDGLATGATMQAAVRAVRTAGPIRVVAAVPVGAPESCALVAELTDAFVCPMRPVLFSAVGQWYHDFSATSDDDVLHLLAAHHRPV